MAHPYAQDLDLFGIGSLFELLSTARTHAGERTLASWLLEPADRQVVRARQEAVTELRPRLDLRERLAVLTEDARTGVDADSLAAWGEAPARLGGRGLRLALWACLSLIHISPETVTAKNKAGWHSLHTAALPGNGLTHAPSGWRAG